MNRYLSLRKSLRKHGAHLNREQRRAWLCQRARLTPRVDIGKHYLPPTVARQFLHVKVA
jgi:hypothetical protein